jgi:hypothetical protein
MPPENECKAVAHRVQEKYVLLFAIFHANNVSMQGGRPLVERRTSRLASERERRDFEPKLWHMLEILNLQVPKDPPNKVHPPFHPELGNYDTLLRLQRELKWWIDPWLEAGSADQWPFAKRLQDDLNRRRLFLRLDADGMLKYGFTKPVRKFGEPLGIFGRFDANPARTKATSMFFDFVTSAFQNEIGRCKRCLKYFWNHSHHASRVYCTNRCASADSATRVIKEKRRAEHQHKLTAAKGAIETFGRLTRARQLKLKRGWKVWVTQNGGNGLTTNFITRAINKGELQPPTFPN